MDSSLTLFPHSDWLIEQDQGLDTLTGIVTRQKYLAQGINSEIDLHNGAHYPLHIQMHI